jgi:biopolymer transport protein ExbD
MAFTIARRRSAPAPNADPNIIPFIDVLLVLLVIFMVTAPKPTTDLRVDLPRREASAPAAFEPTIVRIEPGPYGARLYVGDQETELNRLAAATLAHVRRANPTLAGEDATAEARVFVQANLDVAYHNVVDAIDELKDARFERVSIVAPDADTAL